MSALDPLNLEASSVAIDADGKRPATSLERDTARTEAESPIDRPSLITRLVRTIVLRWGRLGFTDILHDNVRRRGIFGAGFVLFFGTPHLGSFANGIYLNRILKKRRFKRVLDAGCGDGTFVFHVASKYPGTDVVGVDIGEQGVHGVDTTLEVAQRIQDCLHLPNVRFERLDLRQLNDPESFDLVFSFDVLEHIVENGLVLENIYRSLLPGGLLLLRIPTRLQTRILNAVFTAEHDKWAAIEHVGQNHDMKSLLRILEAIGYKVVFATHTMGFFGRLSFELSEMLQYYKLPEAVRFACIPVLKLLRRIDTFLDPKDGDGILALCEK